MFGCLGPVSATLRPLLNSPPTAGHPQQRWHCPRKRARQCLDLRAAEGGLHSRVCGLLASMRE